MSVPPPTVLRRQSPRMAITPTPSGLFGTCEDCGWQTLTVTTSGMISGLAAEHGRVLEEHDASSTPACPHVLEVEG